jgi:hypothetical protein
LKSWRRKDTNLSRPHRREKNARPIRNNAGGAKAQGVEENREKESSAGEMTDENTNGTTRRIQ